MKKFVFPIIMAMAGVFAMFMVFTNVSATTSTELASIRIGDGTSFTEVKVGDTYELPTGTEQLTVEAEPVDPDAEVSIEGDSNFVTGDNTLTITVKGSDGKTTDSYTVTLVKPELAGWCEANADKVLLYNSDYESADVYQDVYYFELTDSRLPEIKANLSCFDEFLQEYASNN